MKHKKAQIFLFPEVDLCQEDNLKRFLNALACEKNFEPNSYAEITEILEDEAYQMVPLDKIYSVSRRGGYPEKENKYDLYLKPQINDGMRALALPTEAYMQICAKEILEQYQALFFAWADVLAETCQPGYGICHLYSDPLVGCKSISDYETAWIMDYPYKWQNKSEKIYLWMRKSSELTEERYLLNGPKGVGLRTYFGGDVMELFGKEFLLKTPGVVRLLSWGGISIDLCQKPWEKEIDELLDYWYDTMTYLQQAEVMAKPVFAEAENRVFMLPGEIWKLYREDKIKP